MNKLIKGDQVIVLTGRDKGKTGKIALRIDDERVVVEGVNLVKKHVKPNPMKGETGGIVQKSMPIHQSNLAIFNTVTGKADRVSIKVDEAAAKGKRRVRVYKSSGEAIKVARGTSWLDCNNTIATTSPPN